MLQAFLTTLLFLFFSLSAFAESADLGTVTVEGSHQESPSERQASEASSTSFTSVITHKDFENRKVTTLEVLQDYSGVQLKRYGGLDQEADISIRGSTSKQVNFYLDGLPLNGASGSSVNLSAIPSDQIESIEVYKGSAPAHFQTSSMGGVVNIKTKKDIRQKRKTIFATSYGSFNSTENTLQHFENHQNWNSQLQYTFSHSNGDYRFLSDNGTPLNPSDDFLSQRKNNKYDRHAFNQCWSWPELLGDDFSLRLNQRFFREDKGIPGLATHTSDSADLSTTQLQNFFELEKKYADGKKINISPYFQYEKNQFTDKRGEIGFGSQDTDDDRLGYGIKGEGERLFGTHHKAGIYLSYDGENFLPDDFIRGNTPNSARHRISLSASDDISLLTDRLFISPTVRAEQIWNVFSARESQNHPLSGQIGIRGVLTQHLSLRTNVGRAYRIPFFSELFGDRGTIIGNPLLKPESGINWDMGIDVSKKEGIFPFHLQITYFLNHLNNLIQWQQTSQYTIQAQNIASARIQGIEVSFHQDLTKRLSWTHHYLFQWAKDTSGRPGFDSNFLPSRPRHELSSRGEFKLDWGTLYSEVNFLDRNYLDSQNLTQVNHRLFINAGWSSSIFPHTTTNLEIRNISNEQTEDVFGFPLPGRSIYGKITFEI